MPLLLLCCLQARTAGLPIVLVLGVSSSPACLLQLLPNALLRRASLLSLALPPARQQLVQVYRCEGQRHPLFLQAHERCRLPWCAPYRQRF